VIRAPLRMSDDDGRRSGIGEHLGRDVAGMRAGNGVVAILSADHQRRAGGSPAHALVGPIIQERANALDGYVDDIRPVGSRTGESFEGVVHTTTSVAVVRVILAGSTLYVVELRGDVDSPRAKQIYDQVVLSFAPH